MHSEKKIIGWREWVSFPDLNVELIKAKVDTGAKTSSMHAFDLKIVNTAEGDFVEYEIHPDQEDGLEVIHGYSKVLEYRNIKSSNGQTETRPVILTTISMLGELFEIELTLTNRDEMGFRLLLGRECFNKRFLIDAGRSFLGKKNKKKL